MVTMPGYSASRVPLCPCPHNVRYCLSSVIVLQLLLTGLKWSLIVDKVFSVFIQSGLPINISTF